MKKPKTTRARRWVRWCPLYVDGTPILTDGFYEKKPPDEHVRCYPGGFGQVIITLKAPARRKERGR